ncbi:MAG TPA: hypothetical protein VGG84_03755 [Gemmatimonadaceae bacterium]
MRTRRLSGSLLLSLAIHVAAGIALVNVVFHYDFSRWHGTTSAPVAERVTYIAVASRGGTVGGTTQGPPAKATTPSHGLVAPVRVPDRIAPPAAPTAGTRGGVAHGTGAGGGEGPTTGIVPGEPDPRLSTDAHQFIPVPKTHAQRVDSAVHALIYAYNDSVAKAAAAAGRKPGDWTFEKGGQKWGIDGNKIYLGKFAIPSAVLAALPLRIQGNPGETLNDRLVTTHRGEVLEHAASQYHDDEFKSAVKRIRERKDRERRERDAQKTVAGASSQD